MDELRKEIDALREQLEKSDITGNTVERQTIGHLNRLIAADEKTFEIGFADLKQFWLSSVDWCSELSKLIEKLIIIQEDLSEAKNQPAEVHELGTGSSNAA